MKRLFALILFLTTIINAQNFKLGFDLGVHQIRTSNQFGSIGILGGEGAPLDYHLRLIYYISKKTSLQARVGNTLNVNFHGWEFGIGGRYLFYDPFFVSAGILEHSNEGGSGSNTWGTNFATIFMLHAGSGVEVTPGFSIEVAYYKAASKEIIGGTHFSNLGYSRIFENMIRLSFLFEWNL